MKTLGIIIGTIFFTSCATHAPMSEMVMFNKERETSSSTDSVANSVFTLSWSFNDEEPSKSNFDLKDNEDYVGNEELGIGDWSLNGTLMVDDSHAGSVSIGGAFGADITLKATNNTYATLTYSLNNSGRLIYQYRVLNKDSFGFSSGGFLGVESKYFYDACNDEPCGRYAGPDGSTQLISFGWRNRFLIREKYKRGLGLTGSFSIGYLPEIKRSFLGVNISVIGF